MVDQIVLELVDKECVIDGISLGVGYADREKKHTGTTIKIGECTNSFKKIMARFEECFENTTDKNAKIRKITVGLNNLMPEDYATVDFFTDIEGEKKENTLQKTVIDIKKKFGKNALMKGTSYQKGATARERNRMVGGHLSGEED